MTDKNIFCNAPWYELQIYWDGSLGFCCQEDHKLYPEDLSSHYNVSRMSIAEWFDSEPMRQARLGMLGSTPNSICSRCYHEQEFNGTSLIKKVLFLPRLILQKVMSKVLAMQSLNQVVTIKVHMMAFL